MHPNSCSIVGTISVIDAIQTKKQYMTWGLHSTGASANFPGAVPGEVVEGQMTPCSKTSIVWPHGCFCYEGISLVAVSPNGKLLAATWDDSTVVLWALSDGSVIRQLQHDRHSDTVLALSFSPDNARLISGSADFNAIIWGVKDGNGERVPWMHTGAITTVAWSPDGGLVAAGAQDANVSVYNAITGDVDTFVGHKSPVTKVVFSPSGGRLASSAESVIFVWNPTTREKVAELNGHQFAIWSFVFSPDGNRIATASEDVTSRVWDAKTGEELLVLHEHTNTVTSVAFSPDGKEVVTSSSDGTSIGCDSLSGQRRHVFEVQESSPTELVAYSPDGSFIVSGHANGSVRLWEAESTAFLVEYTGHFGKIRSIDFAYNGGSEYVVTSASDGTVRS